MDYDIFLRFAQWAYAEHYFPSNPRPGQIEKVDLPSIRSYRYPDTVDYDKRAWPKKGLKRVTGSMEHENPLFVLKESF